MKVLYINGDISTDVINTFFLDFNKISYDSEITIYISSFGGFLHQASAVIDLINNNKHRIELVACGYIYSAAFNIFFFSKCKRRIIQDTMGMIHLSRCAVEFTQAGKPYDESGEFDLAELNRTKNSTIKQLKQIGLNSEELQKVKEGKDCYFAYKRLNELLTYAQAKET